MSEAEGERGGERSKADGKRVSAGQTGERCIMLIFWRKIQQKNLWWQIRLTVLHHRHLRHERRENVNAHHLHPSPLVLDWKRSSSLVSLGGSSPFILRRV